MANETKAVRRYNATIDRTLTLFDANSDWADYIAFLSRLLKALETGRPEDVKDVPSKTKIALSLSRCLQPHLPSGVHQKALVVYHEIFTIIGPSNLAKDLSLYFPGLSHALAFANISTRPLVLGIYTGHLLKLSAQDLRPALKAIILSLLPIVEEETAEDFENYLSTFDSLRVKFASDSQEYFFWQTLFAASISNQTRRAGVLIYLNRFLPRLASADRLTAGLLATIEHTVITTPEPGLLVRCFATGLQDGQALVQRGFLDLLVSHLPLSANVLQLPEHSRDLNVLVSAALSVVLRRDMSLNRRLWSWFTGDNIQKSWDSGVLNSAAGEIGALKGNDYFLKYGYASVGRAIHSMVDVTNSAPTTLSRPFRILLSLMDRWDVGGPVIISNFSLVMQKLLIYQSAAPSQEAFDEVFRSANVFFDAVESTTVFACVTNLVNTGEITLACFIVENFNIDQVDPSNAAVLQLSILVSDMIAPGKENAIMLTNLLSQLMPMLSQETPIPPNERQVQIGRLIESITNVVIEGLRTREALSMISSLVQCLDRTIQLCTMAENVPVARLVGSLQECTASKNSIDPEEYVTVDTSCKVVTSILQMQVSSSTDLSYIVLDYLPVLVSQMWRFLGPNTPQYHVAIVENVWKLQDLTTEYDIIESSILELLNSDNSKGESPMKHSIERFGILFQHSRTVRRASDDFIPPLLKRASLRIVDGCQYLDRHEPGVQWLISLHYLSPIFKLILGEETSSLQLRALSMSRLRKLVSVLMLSDDQWRTFSNSSDVNDICQTCVDVLDQNYAEEWAALVDDAFTLLRKLYNSKAGNTAPESLIKFLVDRLENDSDSQRYSEQILDTLLDILSERTVLPDKLVTVLMQGFSNIPADQRLDKWTALLCNYLPNHASLLQNLLKVTTGFCNRIQHIFEEMQAAFFEKSAVTTAENPERSLANLLSGLEYVLARAHSLAFTDPGSRKSQMNGNAGEPVSSRAQANDRLTVVLCMQDAVSICAKLWAWRSVVRASGVSDPRSFQYTATKLRARSRKILENLVDAEPQECLETIVELWIIKEQSGMLDLLQSLNGARPKAMMPTFFNAIHSRSASTSTNSSLKSSLSVQLDALQLVTSLEEYTVALEDDMVEEIWADCMNFYKDILSNPMPYRHILVRLIRFCALLAHKMQNTNISEETRSLRELSDIFARLVTATFTIKPTGFDSTPPRSSTADRLEPVKTKTPEPHAVADNLLTVLAEALPQMETLLSQYDRSSTVYNSLASSMITPATHSRSFPHNVSLELLTIMRLVPASVKSWKKDMTDAFNQPRFFETPIELAKSGWLPLLKQLQISEKGVLSEHINRLTPPATAGIMLGIGASAARAEADRRTSLDLRRICSLILSGEIDAALAHVPLITQKIEELLSATIESSPSLASRGDVYMLMRTLLLRVNDPSLGRLWPLIDYELRQLCDDVLAQDQSKYSSTSKIQGAKLLELLLLLRPDEFQLHEWLFVTDNLDAVYPNSSPQATSYADQISASLLSSQQSHTEGQSNDNRTTLRPWLAGQRIDNQQDADSLVAQFFGHLNIKVFEDLYSLQLVDKAACEEDLLADMFNEVVA